MPSNRSVLSPPLLDRLEDSSAPAGGALLPRRMLAAPPPERPSPPARLPPVDIGGLRGGNPAEDGAGVRHRHRALGRSGEQS